MRLLGRGVGAAVMLSALGGKRRPDGSRASGEAAAPRIPAYARIPDNLSSA
jgi:hypothetical protein